MIYFDNCDNSVCVRVVCLGLGDWGLGIRGKMFVNFFLVLSEDRIVDQGLKTSGCYSSVTLATETIPFILFQAPPPHLLANSYLPVGFNLDVIFPAKFHLSSDSTMYFSMVFITAVIY